MPQEAEPMAASQGCSVPQLHSWVWPTGDQWLVFGGTYFPPLCKHYGATLTCLFLKAYFPVSMSFASVGWHLQLSSETTFRQLEQLHPVPTESWEYPRAQVSLKISQWLVQKTKAQLPCFEVGQANVQQFTYQFHCGPVGLGWVVFAWICTLASLCLSWLLYCLIHVLIIHLLRVCF
jgi:hypothetical protein